MHGSSNLDQARMTNNSIIFDIKRFAVHDGPGIRTTVFFKGCPLDCSWCHNPEGLCPTAEDVAVCRRDGSRSGSPARNRTIGYTISTEAVVKEILKDEIFYTQSGGGVTFSGGEPMAQVDFLVALLSRCRENRLHTAVDTCGYARWEDFEHVRDMVDLFLFDLKPMDEQTHQRLTGVSNATIHENLRRLADHGEDIVIRLPLIPEITDTEENCSAVASFLRSIPALRRIDLLPYNMLGVDKADRYGMDRPRMSFSTQSKEAVFSIKCSLESSGFSVRIEG